MKEEFPQGELLVNQVSNADWGTEMYRFVEQLYPFHRAITGEGVRQTFGEIAKHIPIQVHEVATGTPVLDWEIPQEWKIRDAYIADAATGQRIVCYADSNLHVVNYSQPVNAILSWNELEAKLFTVAGQRNWIPYRTAYFREEWGFCVSEHQKQLLSQRGIDRFQVVIDSQFFDGALSYAEAKVSGKTDRTVLLYAHTCHPSLANDNLSGIAVATFLTKVLRKRSLRYSYRIVFAPATIGAITWLSRNEEACQKIDFGLVLTLLGDSGSFTYKRSQRETAAIDRIASHVLMHQRLKSTTRRFTPTGYDERQFCSPGFDLPVGCLMRTPHGEFPQYHTSADDLTFITAGQLADSLELCLSMIDVIEGNMIPISCRPKGEPQLGRHGVYRAYGELDDRGRLQEAILWLLNQANGSRDLLSIAERADLPFDLVRRAADLLINHNLIRVQP